MSSTYSLYKWDNKTHKPNVVLTKYGYTEDGQIVKICVYVLRPNKTMQIISADAVPFHCDCPARKSDCKHLNIHMEFVSASLGDVDFNYPWEEYYMVYHNRKHTHRWWHPEENSNE